MTDKTAPGFTDIHHHIIYGVDDGPRTLEDSHAMLALAYADGTRRIIATPHFDPVGHCPDVPLLKDRVEELNQICAKDFPGLKIFLGAEVLFGEGFRRKLRAGLIPTMAGSEYVLVEFVPAVKKDRLEQAVRHLANVGYVTVIAHAERYAELVRDLQFIQHLKGKYGTLLQVNAGFVLSRKGFRARRFLKEGLRLGLIDFIASDAHNTESRKTLLTEAFTTIKSNFGDVPAIESTIKLSDLLSIG